MNSKSLSIIALGIIGGILVWLAFRSNSSAAASPISGVPLTGTTGKLGTAASGATGLASVLAGLFGSGSGTGAAPSPSAGTLSPKNTNSVINQSLTPITNTQSAGTATISASQLSFNSQPIPSASQQALMDAGQAGSPPQIALSSVSTPPDLSFLSPQYENSVLPPPVLSSVTGFDAGNSSNQNFGSTSFDPLSSDYSVLAFS